MLSIAKPSLYKPSSKSTVSQKPKEVIIEERVTTKNALGGKDNQVIRYRRGKLLGKGGFAKCYEFYNLTTGQLSAGKVIDKKTLQKSKTKQKLSSEIKIHSSLHHKHIVAFEKFFEDKNNVYILLECCKCKTLMELMKKKKRLTESEARYFIAQMLDAVEYMHDRMIIHRDLKLGNLFLNEKMEIKIGDFGLAAQLLTPDERKLTVCGTPNYIAPEILKGKDGHSYEVDIWSIGVILYTLLIGTPPFETSNVHTTYKKIKANIYSFPSSIPISQDAKNLIKKILILDPRARPSIQEIRNHPFMTKNMSPLNPCPITLMEYAYQCTGNMNAFNNFVNNPLRPIPTKPAQLKLLEKKETAERVPFKQLNMHLEKATDRLPKYTPRSAFEQQENRYPKTRTKTFVPTGRDNHITKPAERVKSAAGAPVGLPTTEKLFERREYPFEKKETHLEKNNIYERMEHRNIFEKKEQVTENKDMMKDVQIVTKKEPEKKKPDVYNIKDEDNEDEGNLTSMHNNIQNSFAINRKPTQPVDAKAVGQSAEEDENLAQPTVWVTQWIDFSNKYGLGYRLNTGITGAHYNDSTKLLWNILSGNIEYYERKRTSSGSYDEKNVYKMESYPETMNKKITLIKYFHSYLAKHSKDKKPILPDTRPEYDHDYVYVKRWLRTRHAVIFRLSNKTVQVCFFDNTEIILSSEARLVTYTNHQGERKTFSLSSIVNKPQPDVAKRLKYTKDILYQLINRNK